MAHKFYLTILLLSLIIARVDAQTKSSATSQYPSPMVETTRSHQHIEKKELAGIRFQFKNFPPGKVEVFIPEPVIKTQKINIWLHFHGAAYITEHAATLIWAVLFGWEIAVSHLVHGVLLAITIIGLPFAKQHFKLIPLALFPFGRELR